MMKNIQINTWTTNKGMGMTEVLIALLVFSTGVLGVASMQLSGISALSNANLMSYAVMGANNMADRMRANQQGTTLGYYNNITGNETNPGCGSSCSPAQTANADAYAVKQFLNTNLPSPTFTVQSTNDDMLTITIKWTEKDGSSLETKTHRFTFLPYRA